MQYIACLLEPYFYNRNMSWEEQTKHAANRIGLLQRALIYVEEKLSSVLSLLSKEEAKTKIANQRVVELETYLQQLLPTVQAALDDSSARVLAAEKKSAELEARLEFVNRMNYEQY